MLSVTSKTFLGPHFSTLKMSCVHCNLWTFYGALSLPTPTNQKLLINLRCCLAILESRKCGKCMHGGCKALILPKGKNKNMINKAEELLWLKISKLYLPLPLILNVVPHTSDTQNLEMTFSAVPKGATKDGSGTLLSLYFQYFKIGVVS